MSKRYGDYEQVNGAVVNDLLNRLDAIKRIANSAYSLRDSSDAIDRIYAIVNDLVQPESAVQGRETGDSLCCMDCGTVYGGDAWLDVVLPDDQWEAVSGRSDGSGILCAACIVRRGAQLPGVTVAKLHFPDLGSAVQGQRPTLPECMAPDGAEPCKAYQDLEDALKAERKQKNKLVLVAYPKMDALDRVQKLINSAEYLNSVFTVAQIQRAIDGKESAVEKLKPPECPYCFPKDGKHAASCELASASEGQLSGEVGCVEPGCGAAMRITANQPFTLDRNWRCPAHALDRQGTTER